MVFRKRKNTIEVSDVLFGCAPGQIQSVGYMQVIPLISEISDDRFVSPINGETRVQTSNYGSLGFQNRGDSVVIIPCNAGYVVKHAAQDHAMAHAGVVGSSTARTYDTAMCVQQSQGGLIREGEYQMSILPYALRERAIDKRTERQYNRLWDAISLFNKELGVRAEGNLVAFLDRFKDELDQFVAEFECVPQQIGAIILVDDQVVGIERAPSHQYWLDVWPSLIRECYGSLAIQVAQRKGQPTQTPASRYPIPDDVESLDELESLIADIASQEDQRARETVRILMNDRLELTVDEKTCDLSIETIKSERFTGQVIRDGDRVVYASMPIRKRWLSENVWLRAQPFEI